MIRGMRCRSTILIPFLVPIAAGLILGLPASAAYSRGDTEKGTASWIGKEEQGGRTASGERFDRYKLTAAHRHLPFNTLVRVTNTRNGKSVKVRINDRGPWNSRIIDISEAAAEILGMKKSGTAPVIIEVLELPSRHH